MTLRKKTLLIIGVMLIGLIAMLYAVSQTVFLDSFSKLEKQDTSQNVERALGALSDDISNLNAVVGDWAPWDDTYNFVEDINNSYVENNLNDNTFANLRVNLMLFINSSGQIVFGKAFDLQNKQEVPVPESLEESISANNLLIYHPNADSKVSGFLLFPECPMLIASQPILTSQNQGPIRGTLIMGRYLDSAEIASLAETTRLSLTVYRLDEPQMPADFEAARSALSEKEAIFVRPLDSKSVAGYTLIKDIYGAPALVLRAEMPRGIYQQGQTSLVYFISLLVGVSLLFVVVVVLLLERFMLSPLSRLSVSVSNIAESGDLSKQVTVRGRDELSSLTGDINKMLKALQQSQEALRESELVATTTIEGMADGVMLVNMKGKVTYVNKAFEKLLGHKAEEIVGSSALELPTYRSSKDREQARAALKMLIEKGSAKAVDMTAITKDGEEIPISFNASLIKDAQGNPKILVAVLRDVTERRWAEEALRRSEEYLRALMENSLDAVTIMNEDGSIRYESPSYEGLLGFKPEERVGGGLYERIHLDDITRVAELFAEFLKNRGGTLRTEVRAQHKDGSWRFIEAIGQNLLDNSIVEGIVVNLRDITERKKAEEALLKSEKRLRDIVENSREWIWEVDTKGKYTYSSPIVESILGYTPEEILEKHFYDLFHPDDRESLKQGAFEAFARKELFHGFVNRNASKDGKTVWLSTSGIPLLDNAGNLMGYRGSDTDITESKKAEEELRRSEEKLRLYLDNSPDAIYINDMNGNFLYGNNAAERLIGYPKEELIGKSFLELNLLSEEYLLKGARILELNIAGKSTEPVEFELIRKDGSNIFLEISTHPLGEGDKLEVIGIGRDTTERKRMEEALRKSEAQLRTIFDEAAVGIIVLDTNAKPLEVNHALLQMLGCSMEDFNNMSYPDYVHPEDLANDFEFFGEMVTGMRDKYDIEKRFIRKAGGLVWTHQTLSLVRDSEGKPQYLIILVEDITERKKMEEELRRLSDAVKMTTESVAIADLKGRIVDINEAGLRMYSLDDRADLVGKNPLDIIVPEDQPKALENMSKIVETGSVKDIEYHIMRKDGKKALIETSVSLIRGEKGEPKGIVAVARDITERRQMEEALRESEERYRRLVDNAQDIIFRFSADKGLEYVSPAVTKITGYTPEELMADPKLGFGLATANDERLAADYEKVITQGLSLRTRDLTSIGKDGRQIYLDMRSQAVRDKDGNVVAFEGILRDVTESRKDEEEKRKMAEELAQSEAKYRSLIETAGAGVATTDLKGEFVLVNEALCNMLGYSREELLGKNFADFLQPEDMAGVLALFARGLEGKREQLSMEFRVIHKEGRIIWCYSSPTPLINQNETIGFSAIVYDITQRKRAEEALKESEEKHRALVDTAGKAGEGISIVQDVEGREAAYVFVNDEFCKMTGYSREELLSMKAHDLIQPAEFSEILDRYKRRQRGENLPAAYELTFVRKDGTLMPVEAGFGVINYSGKVATVAFHRDITERKRAEEALKSSEERYRLVVENATEAILVAQDGMLKFFNTRVVEMLGYSREELASKPFIEFIHPEDQSMVAGRHRARLGGGEVPSGYSFRVVDGAGNVRWVEISAVVVNWEGRPATLNFLTDITERREGEEALKRSEEKLRLMFESITDGIVVTDSNGVIIEANEGAAQIGRFGSKEAILGKSAFELIAPRYHEEAAVNLQKTLEQSSAINMEYTLIRADGSEYPGELSAAVLKDAYGNPVGFVGIVRDITVRRKAEEDRHRMEEQLRLAGRLAAVGELAAGVAHELNNPIAAIQGFAQLLTGRNDLDETTKNDLGIVYREAQRAAKITQNLLSFARKHEPEKRLISLNEVIGKTLELQAYQMKVNNIELVVDFAADLPKTMADFFQMQQVFVNLINNAEQAMVGAHGKGRLVVKTQQVGNMIQISFADDGPGIPEENMKRIFDPFFTTKEVGKGTGLGLSICYGIVEAHGGRIYARSKLGEGATFVVEIPIILENQ